MKEYFYHYTSIETLALILKNKTIRFGRLDLVDDIDESKTADFGELGRFFFVSCWTDQEKESIPQWSMYTPNMQGVRLKVRKNPFQKEHIELYGGESRRCYKGLNNLVKSRNLLTIYDKNEYYKIKYTDKFEYPEIIGFQEDLTPNSNMNKVGKVKSKAWEFQQEVRYQIVIIPNSSEEIIRDEANGFSGMRDYLLNRNLDFQYIDVPMTDEAFNDIEIMCGPKMNEAQQIIVELLIQKFCPNMKINYSQLNIR